MFIERIDALVKKINNELGRVFNADIDFIYKTYDIKYIEIDPESILLKNNKSIRIGKNLVYIDNSLDYVSKRFILFHELGHILLEHDFIYNLNCRAHIYKSEKEANYFAFKMMKFHLNSEEILSYGIDKILDYIQNHQGTFTEEDYYEESCNL